ncbi:ATP-binding cassette domain-containing protein [Rhodococcus qingshengii]|uniref:ATP-binding cassette domain-containing protein n=1 Tax=Rhodococcus qingshengii TaxID=334542 RepID=UPI001ABF00FB|nr:ATP-binding cassette domain-containing protein [Rhodococcus qingshengii]
MTLQARDIGVRFSGVIALDGIDVAVEPGRVLAVVGPNGSGKSTLFNAITGFVPLYSGTVTVDGTDLSADSADSRIRAGVARTFQTPRIDAEQTMLDSIMCGFLPSMRTALVSSLLGGPGIEVRERRARAATQDMLEMFALADQADLQMGQLPLGSVRMADVLRAMAMRPKYLLLDEPAAGLSHEEQARLVAGIRAIAADGVGVLLVEHNFALVRDIADELVVLAKGKVLAAGDPDQVSSNPKVVEVYLGAGTEHHALNATRTPAQPETALQVRGLEVAYGRAQVCHGVDLEVKRGEIVTVLGANGAGKSSLMMALAGIGVDNRRWSGEVTLGAKDITRLAAERRPAAGLSFVPERRGNIFPRLTVGENLQIAARVLPHAERAASLDNVQRLFPVLERLAETQSSLLSGGEQQMVAIAVALAVNPSVLVLDEPTQGLAPAVLDDIVDTLLMLRDNGLAILLAEQNQGFAAALADRFLVLAHGEVALTGGRAELQDREALAEAYL